MLTDANGCIFVVVSFYRQWVVKQDDIVNHDDIEWIRRHECVDRHAMFRRDMAEVIHILIWCLKGNNATGTSLTFCNGLSNIIKTHASTNFICSFKAKRAKICTVIMWKSNRFQKTLTIVPGWPYTLVFVWLWRFTFKLLVFVAVFCIYQCQCSAFTVLLMLIVWSHHWVWKHCQRNYTTFWESWFVYNVQFSNFW